MEDARDQAELGRDRITQPCFALAGADGGRCLAAIDCPVWRNHAFFQPAHCASIGDQTVGEVDRAARAIEQRLIPRLNRGEQRIGEISILAVVGCLDGEGQRPPFRGDQIIAKPEGELAHIAMIIRAKRYGRWRHIAPHAKLRRPQLNAALPAKISGLLATFEG